MLTGLHQAEKNHSQPFQQGSTYLRSDPMQCNASGPIRSKLPRSKIALKALRHCKLHVKHRIFSKFARAYLNSETSYPDVPIEK